MSHQPQSLLSIDNGFAETFRREGVGDSVEAFRGADHEHPLGIEGRCKP